MLGKKFDVVTIGTATRDVFLMSPLFKVFKDPDHLKTIGVESGEAQCFAMGAKIDLERVVFTTGGGALNTAVTFARQGLKVAAVASVGDDDRGKDILNTLKREGASSFVHTEAGALTTYSTILLAEGGERTILVYRNKKETLTSDRIPFNEIKSKWAYIVPGAMDLETLKELTDNLQSKKIKMAINPSKHFLSIGKEAITPILSKMSVVSLNREEAGELTGISYEKTEEIFKAMDDIVDGVVIMTDGPKGVIVSDGEKIYRAGIFKEEKIVDRTGAGDAFGSGFVAALIRELSIPEAIRLASANATSVVEHIGGTTGAITKEDLSSSRWQNLEIKIDNL